MAQQERQLDVKKKRQPEDVKKNRRSAFWSLYSTNQPEPPATNPANFLRRHFWPWLKHYLATLFLPRQRFATYAAPPSERPGIITIPSDCRLALAGDWGTGTESAYRVAEQIRKTKPEVTIHLGDVYYSGTEKEYANYFLGKDDWPPGTIRTFALNGNHEMYSGGKGYFGSVLKALGQETSYFCLENEQWRIVAVDTGYYARTFPFLELLLHGLIRVHRENRRWLAQVVFADPRDRRPVILLSHHPWFSAFDTEYGRVGRSVAPYLDRVLLWIWAHEHRCAGYGPFARGGHRIRARSIGHGGMPIELGREGKRDRNLVFFDQRRAGDLEGEPIGYCGFALLSLAGPELRVSYIDEKGVKLVEEVWTMRGQEPVGTIAYCGVEVTELRPIAELVAP